MAEKNQKYKVLDKAIDIAKEYARGGHSAKPSILIKDAYEAIIEIINEIEQSEQPEG